MCLSGMTDGVETSPLELKFLALFLNPLILKQLTLTFIMDVGL